MYQQMEDTCSFIAQYSILFRKKEIDFLSQFLGKFSMQYRSLFIYGPNATGKTFVVSNFLKYFSKKYVWINCFEHIDAISLSNAVLRQISKNNNHNKIDNIFQFVKMLKEELKDSTETIYLVLDNVHIIRKENQSLIPILIMLQKLTEVNICPILISRLPWDNIIDQKNILMPVSLHFPNYSSKEMTDILLLNCPPDFEKSIYSEYVDIILKIFFTVLRNLSELRKITDLNFDAYCDHLRENRLRQRSTIHLRKNIEPILMSTLKSLHLQEVPDSWETYGKINEKENRMPRNLNISCISQEIACYSKLLLISAYFASFNCPRNDFKDFVINQEKKAKKSKKKLKRNRDFFNPKAFNLDRLFSIFYSFAGKLVLPSSVTNSQISSLLSNNLLAIVPVDDKLESPTYICSAKYSLVCKVGESIGIDVMGCLKDYL